MIAAPEEVRWIRPKPRRKLPAPLLERIVNAAFPCARILDIQPLAGGLRNANFKLRLDSLQEQLVLRVYAHDASLCQKEVDLIRLIEDSVPVPEVIQRCEQPSP
jgi:hypothetical protein